MAATTANATAHAVDPTAFRAAYRASVRDVLRFLTPERIAVIARHNPGWKPGGFDLEGYLWNSEARYVAALETFARCGGQPGPEGLRVLDIGGFLGAFPLALARSGAQVTLSEKYGYYYGAFDALRDFLAGEGVEVWDADLASPIEGPADARFDLVAAMAILEHLPNSPRPLLDNARTLAAPSGRVLVDVPNIAHWPKRLAFLLGRSPLAPLEHVWEAEEPFTGHHREYTARELTDVISWSGLRVCELVHLDYWPREPAGLVRRLAVQLPARRFPRLREVLLVCAAP